MPKFFWSDTHFGHHKIIQFQPKTRGHFSSTEEMNEWMIERWNKTVRPVDEIFFLGDFSFEKDPTATLSRLNGKKHLVTGNHDSNRPVVMKLPWESVQDYLVVKDNGIRAVCSHYPFASWHWAHKSTLHLHGHCHGSLKQYMPHRFDVGVDVYDEPKPLEFFAELASKQAFEPSDHHAE